MTRAPPHIGTIFQATVSLVLQNESERVTDTLILE